MKKFLIYAVLLVTYILMAILIANNALFLHSHYLSDGTVITHAHPFKKSSDSTPISSHNHSKIELIILENLLLLFFLIFTVFIAETLIKFRYYILLKSLFFESSTITFHQGRAPPVFK